MEIASKDVSRLTDYMERLLLKMKSIDRSCLGDLSKELTFPEFQVVIYLGKEGPARMSRIAEQLSISLSNLTVIVDKLVAKKLVMRGRSDTDRRVVVVELLPMGTRISEGHHEMKLNLCREMLSSLDDGEREVYIDLMQKLTAAS